MDVGGNACDLFLGDIALLTGCTQKSHKKLSD